MPIFACSFTLKCNIPFEHRQKREKSLSAFKVRCSKLCLENLRNVFLSLIHHRLILFSKFSFPKPKKAGRKRLTNKLIHYLSMCNEQTNASCASNNKSNQSKPYNSIPYQNESTQNNMNNDDGSHLGSDFSCIYTTKA